MRDDLRRGLRRFRDERYPDRRELFERLAQGQSPTTLFIGCSDSRLVPDLLTDSEPGDLFVVRNVANIVPPWEPGSDHAGTSAAIEFAVAVLGVSDVVVCGHSACGGIAAMYGPLPPEVPHLGPWLEIAREAALSPEEIAGLDETAAAAVRVQRNVELSLRRLRDFPMVAERLEAGSIALHGWYFDIGAGRIDVLDPAAGRFVDVDELPA